jgi:hypothetical protein
VLALLQSILLVCNKAAIPLMEERLKPFSIIQKTNKCCSNEKRSQDVNIGGGLLAGLEL